MRVIRTASLRPLKNKQIAVIGYGAQGRAQALNLCDAGFLPIIGLPSRSKSRRIARRDRFDVTTPRRAADQADIILMLAPDHVHGKLFEDEIRSVMRQGHTLAFAHASSVHFGFVSPPSNVDVVLVAPLGPGKRLRELRGAKQGVACFVAVHQNPSNKAQAMALALANAIGCLPAGAIETTFAHEAIGDLFGEQAVLCGGLGELLKAGVETLVRHGHSPQTAYLECVYQLDLMVDLIKSEGLAGMYERISPTAAHGAAVAGPKIISPMSRRSMERVFKSIESGQFFQDWVHYARRTGKPRLPKISSAYRRGERDVHKSLGE